MPPDPKPPKPLNQIADEMYATLAKADGQCHHPCGHGLHTPALHLRCVQGASVVLQRLENLWLLKLCSGAAGAYRQKVYPSELEVVLRPRAGAYCKRAFRLADDQHEQRLDPTACPGKAGDCWHVTAINWTGPIPKPKGTRP